MPQEASCPSKPTDTLFPWLAYYPPGAPATIETPPYRLIGDIPADLAARRGRLCAFTTVLPNGMAGDLSFAEVDRLSDQFAVFLRDVLRLETGTRVAVQIPNGLAFPIAAFGIFKAGCVLVNVNPLYTAHEITELLKDATPDVLLGSDVFADKLAQALGEVPVPHVVLCSVASLFPTPKRQLIGFVQKYIRRDVRKPRFPFTTFDRALTLGARRLRHGADVKSYTMGVEPTAVAVLQYTGGTTGVSKGAMLTHRNLIMNVAQFLNFNLNGVRESDHLLTVLPLYHIFAFTANMLGFFVRGAHNILIPNPRPLTNLRAALARQPITFITGVNTLFNGLLSAHWFTDNLPPHLRMSVAGGMALQNTVADRWQTITGTPILEGYGLSEASPVLTLNPESRPKLGTIGLPLPSTEIRCVDEKGETVPWGEPGELIARGPQIMLGYWKQPGETANALRDGWLYTGDIATMDAEGYVRIVDRRKDMIDVSGFKVFPNEVEAILAAMPGVRECAIIGVPDAATGEAVKAFIVSDDPTMDADQVRAFCRTELASYKVPKFVEFRADLPKSHVGKILRKDLRETAV